MYYLGLITHLQSVMFEILMLTLIFLLKIPTHNYEFRINAKITVHCTFSSDSDAETGEFLIPLKKEVRYGAPTLRFLNSNYIYANLPLCELTTQAKGREYLRPPQFNTRFTKDINRAIIYAPGSSHAYIQQNHHDITTHVT